MEKTTPLLVDTCIFVEHFRKNPLAIAFFSLLNDRDDVFYSAITEVELVKGKSNSNESVRSALLRFLRRWNKIPVGNPLAALAGDYCRQFDMAIADAIIAATARENQLLLVTHDINDFKRVPGIQIKSPY